MLVVKDVEASSRWYQKLLGAQSGHGGPEFEMIMRDDQVMLYLHHSDTEEHPGITDPSTGTPGLGVLLYVRDPDVEGVHARALEMEAEVLEEPHENPLAQQVEFSVRDPDGYALTIYRRIQG